MQVLIQKNPIIHKRYRDRIYIVKDLLSKLIELGDINQTALSSFCGINVTKHRKILDELENNGLITKYKQNIGKRVITMYGITTKGYGFHQSILNPFEEIIPRNIMNLSS